MARLIVGLTMILGLCLLVFTGAQAQSNAVNAGTVRPSMCVPGDAYIDTTTPAMSRCTTPNTWVDVPLSGGGATWGTITGVLSTQTDLQGELDATVKKSANLSDVANAGTARTNLGLGSLATQSGTFSGTSSGTNTGDQTTISGNAGSATVLATPRTINGVSFNGSANITVAAAGSTLSDNVPVTKLNSGTNAGASTFWRGDATWAAPSGSSYRTLVTLGSDVTDSSGASTYADCTGLSFAVVSGTRYHFYALIWYTSAASTTGSAWSINGPAATNMAYTSRYTLTATTATTNYAAAYNIPAAANASSLTTTNTAVLEGTILPSANGTVIVRFATEIDTSAVVCKAGSTLEWW